MNAEHTTSVPFTTCTMCFCGPSGCLTSTQRRSPAVQNVRKVLVVTTATATPPEVSGYVTIHERGRVFPDEIGRVALVERGDVVRVIGTERLGRGRGVQIDWHGPAFREEQGADAVANQVFASNFERDGDAIHRGNGRRLYDPNTHQRRNIRDLR